MFSRNFNRAALALVVLILSSGCARKVDLRPGRDAYYQVTTQFVPAQATGSHSQDASMITSGSVGSVSQPSTPDPMDGVDPVQ